MLYFCLHLARNCELIEPSGFTTTRRHSTMGHVSQIDLEDAREAYVGVHGNGSPHIERDMLGPHPLASVLQVVGMQAAFAAAHPEVRGWPALLGPVQVLAKGCVPLSSIQDQSGVRGSLIRMA